MADVKYEIIDTIGIHYPVTGICMYAFRADDAFYNVQT